MTFENIQEFNILKEEITKNNVTKIFISKSDLKTAIEFLKNNCEYQIDMLITIVCIDLTEKLELNYEFFSTKTNKNIIVSMELEEGNPIIETISDIFASANYDEREIFDMFGVEFTNHPNLKRILMPEGWIGNPLRKYYKQEDERLSWNEK